MTSNVNLAHIGSELIVLGSIVFYFHKKTGDLGTRVEILEKENRELKDKLTDVVNQINQIGSLLIRLQNSQGQNAPQSMPQSGLRHRKPHIPQSQAQPVKSQPQSPLQPQQTKSQPQQTKSQPKSVLKSPLEEARIVELSDDEEDFDNEDLDKELEQELSTLNKERDCDDDKCSLID
jgi:hypothetical protein